MLCCSPQDLSRKCKISVHDADTIIDLLYASADPPRLWRLADIKDQGSEICTTGDPILDEALGGGLRTGAVWEVVGERCVPNWVYASSSILRGKLQSAAGKTQFALQFALTVQLPRNQKGLHGSACYLTTSSVLPTSRLVQISEAHPLLARSECSLHNVHTISTTTIPMLIHVLSGTLPDFINQQASVPGRKPVKILIIDALAELFHTSTKTTSQTLIERSKNIAQISFLLHKLASTHQIVVVVLNEVVDAFDYVTDLPDPSGGHDILYAEQARWFARGHSLPSENRKEASLGLVWANQVNVRILLTRTGRRRYLDDADYQPIKRFRPHSDSSAGAHTVVATSNISTTDQSTLIRRLSVIFSSVARPVSLDYTVTEAGISVISGETSTVGEEPQLASAPSNDEKQPFKDPLELLPCSQIAPLDVGISEGDRTAAEEFAERGNIDEPEDEWDKYWAEDEISADMYDTLGNATVI